ncbi:uncharacterized protein [Cherax quadricarinatus]|uniref:uncharacterized protein n=1 Tax=Cherax quadricarinatus TaxID=27406 RepID=UPI00387E86BB
MPLAKLSSSWPLMEPASSASNPLPDNSEAEEILCDIRLTSYCAPLVPISRFSNSLSLSTILSPTMAEDEDVEIEPVTEEDELTNYKPPPERTLEMLNKDTEDESL